MTIIFVNHSVHDARISVNGGEAHVIGGKKSLCLDLKQDFFSVSVQRNEHGKKRAKCDCIIKTEYHVFGANENTVFHIDREKMQVAGTLAYDTMLLSSESAECTPKKYTAEDAEFIKNDYRKSHLFDVFILQPVMDFFLAGGIVFAVLLLLLGIFVSWVLAGIAFTALYLFDVAMNFIGDKTSDIFCKKVANIKPEKEELYALLESENIKTFYMNPMRKSWCGEAERD